MVAMATPNEGLPRQTKGTGRGGGGGEGQDSQRRWHPSRGLPAAQEGVRVERSSQEDAWEEQAPRSGGAGEAGDSAGWRTKPKTESDADHRRPSLRVLRPPEGLEQGRAWITSAFSNNLFEERMEELRISPGCFLTVQPLSCSFTAGVWA